VTARHIGIGLLREAIAQRGRMDLSSYDRLFPSQDVLQAGGLGNLIAAPLQGRARRRGATVFLDLATLEPHEDQWAYLSSLDRMTPRDVTRLAQQLGGAHAVSVGAEVDRIRSATATKISVQPPPVVRATLAARISVDGTDLTGPSARIDERVGIEEFGVFLAAVFEESGVRFARRGLRQPPMRCLEGGK
jgi:hypothetical protein